MATDATDDAPLVGPMMGPVFVPPSLESRIKARCAEIIARLGELEEDTRIEAVEARDNLTAKLSELGHIIKEGLVDGWANLGDLAKKRLDHWLAN